MSQVKYKYKATCGPASIARRYCSIVLSPGKLDGHREEEGKKKQATKKRKLVACMAT